MPAFKHSEKFQRINKRTPAIFEHMMKTSTHIKYIFVKQGGNLMPLSYVILGMTGDTSSSKLKIRPVEGKETAAYFGKPRVTKN